ncbi:MAG: O-antigen ligase family protein, partial [Candidatus Sumerlaeota bacterium]
MKRLQLDNFGPLETEEEEEALVPSDKVFYLSIFAGVFAFFIITYPYRDIRIPSAVLALVALIVFILLTVASYLRPQYFWASIAFCIYIPFSGEYPGDFGQRLLGMNFTNLIVLPIILQWWMQRNYTSDRMIKYHAPDIFLFIFCILSSISVIRIGVESGTSSFFGEFVRLKRWLFPFFLYFLFVNIKRNDKGVKYLIVTICTTLTAVAILTMKESYDIGPGGSWDRIRVRGVLGSPNGTGAFFVYYTLLFLGLFLCYWRHSRYSFLLLVPFFLSGRAMTLANSRGGIIAFTLAILATLWVRSKILFAIGLGIVVWGYFNPEYLPETISGRLFSTIRPVSKEEILLYDDLDSFSQRLETSAAGRLRIWRAGMRMVMQRPWFGWGYGEFPRQVGWFGEGGTYDPKVAQRDPHNSYLGIAAEMGLIALAFFVLTLLLILRAALHVYHHAPDTFMRAIGLASVGMILGVMSANFFGSRLDTTELTAYLWIISAVIVQYSTELRAK